MRQIVGDLRYRTDEIGDGLRREEGTFAICSFWLVSALAEIGETRRARELCEKMLGSPATRRPDTTRPTTLP